MRSDLVYRANDKVPNRFQLCRLTSTSARSMIRASVEMHTTINQALTAISGHSSPLTIELPRAIEAPVTAAPAIDLITTGLEIPVSLPVFGPVI